MSWAKKETAGKARESFNVFVVDPVQPRYGYHDFVTQFGAVAGESPSVSQENITFWRKASEHVMLPAGISQSESHFQQQLWAVAERKHALMDEGKTLDAVVVSQPWAGDIAFCAAFAMGVKAIDPAIRVMVRSNGHDLINNPCVQSVDSTVEGNTNLMIKQGDRKVTLNPNVDGLVLSGGINDDDRAMLHDLLGNQPALARINGALQERVTIGR